MWANTEDNRYYQVTFITWREIRQDMLRSSRTEKEERRGRSDVGR